MASVLRWPTALLPTTPTAIYVLYTISGWLAHIMTGAICALVTLFLIPSVCIITAPLHEEADGANCSARFVVLNEAVLVGLVMISATMSCDGR